MRNSKVVLAITKESNRYLLMQVCLKSQAYNKHECKHPAQEKEKCIERTCEHTRKL
jgi:hypothetical protein